VLVARRVNAGIAAKRHLEDWRAGRVVAHDERWWSELISTGPRPVR
jgi:hypothetical protein